jgi:hypothetical protein
MTSSPAPHNETSSRPLGFVDAARLHARRFDKRFVASALRLLSADQRVSHPDGGIAILNKTGHPIRWTIAFVTTFVPAVTAMVIALATPNVATMVIGTSIAVASALMLAPRCERQIRARRSFDTTNSPWVLSDVATQPHQGIGDQLMSQVCVRADEAAVTVVLEVTDIDDTAQRLYLRHGFKAIGRRVDRVLMRRDIGSGSK